MVDKTKFTVLIPTRERPDTLHYCLQTVIAQKYDNLEIVVSDNASQDNTEQVVRRVADSRVKYVNTGRRLSMSHNFEFALSQVRDGWVTYVGDDDGLIPGGLEYVDEVIRETRCQAVSSRFGLYIWPGLDADGGSRLSVPYSRGYGWRNSREWLGRVLAGHNKYFELPMLYTGGFASLDAIRRATGPDGKFFRSMIPDVYSGIALASVLPEYVSIRRPVAISGASPHSTGCSQLGGYKHKGPAEKFYAEDNIPFHASLGNGKVKDLQILVYESYLQAFPLHHDFLKVRLFDQLALALVGTPAEKRDEFKSYVREVAAANGLDFDEVVRTAEANATHQLRSIRNQAKQWFTERSVHGSYGATNIQEAVWVASAIWGERTERPGWRAGRLWRHAVAQTRGALR